MMIIPVVSLPGAPSKIYASAQTIPQETNNQNLENMTQSTGATNVTRNENNTFLAEGTIDQLIPFSPATTGGPEGPFLLGGDWVLSVNGGRVDDFGVRIVMVAEDGTLLHVHSIQNLTNVTSRISPIGIEQQSPPRSNNISLSVGTNDTITISGFADITTNGVTQWEDVAVTISIVNGNVFSIIPNPAEVDHFYALPIYGIVSSIVGQSGQSLRDQQLANNATLVFHGRGAIDFDYEEGDVNGEDNVAAAGEGSSPGTIANDQSDVNPTGMDGEPRIEERDAATGDELPDNARGIAVPDELSEQYLRLNSTASQSPIVQELSDNQNYAVQLRWTPYDLLLPQDGLSYTVYFLDGQQPRSTEDIVPPWISNYSGFSRANPSLFVDPNMLNFEAVESYDMTVYSDTGSVLWQKDDLQVYGGRDWGMITFAETYRGPITVEISDIKPAQG
ncbi:MAG: hypothetical protein M3M87_04635, partial [Thermoproteota archaeon]|nr:hypothetical protein [Thermoproteota archaeon]